MYVLTNKDVITCNGITINISTANIYFNYCLMSQRILVTDMILNLKHITVRQ